jgi:hypothetical protein
MIPPLHITARYTLPCGTLPSATSYMLGTLVEIAV